MIPASIIAATVRSRVSYVTVGAILYRIESVDSAKLADVGMAYLQGLREAVPPEGESQAEAAIRAESETGEEAARRLAEYRERERARAMRAHRAAVSTPEGAEAYLARIRAYVLAGVTGIGEPPQAIESPADGVPGVEHHGADWAPPGALADVRIVDAPREEWEPVEAALRRHGDRGEWPLWAMEPADCVVLATLIASLAGGAASRVAPFRVGSGCGGVAGEAG